MIDGTKLIDILSDLLAGNIDIYSARDLIKSNIENPWISVDERLPEETNDFLVCIKEHEGYCYVDIVSYMSMKEEWALSGVTHWMPLPDPQEEKE